MVQFDFQKLGEYPNRSCFSGCHRCESSKRSRSIMGNLEVWYRDYLDFTPPSAPSCVVTMGRSAEKRAADRLLTQAKLDQSDATTYAKYVEACINVMFHNQKGLSLAKLNDMKKAVSPGMRLWPAFATFTRVSAEKIIQLCRCLCRREGKHSHTATRTRRRRGRCGQDHAGPPVRRTSR